MATNLRVLHAHFSLDKGGEAVIWGEEQRRWPGRARPMEGEHPFSQRDGELRTGLGKRLRSLSELLPASPHVEMTEELQQALGWQYLYLARTEQEAHDNERTLTLLLPSIGGTPLPSSLMAEALGIELPESAELRAWDVEGRAVGPETLIALRDGITAMKGERLPAPTLDYLAELARLSIALARSGALLPTSAGWELDEGVLARLSGRFQMPEALISQHAGIENLETQILSSFARQFALGALANASGSGALASRGAEPWVQWLEGVIEFGLWPRNLTSAATEQLVGEIEKARKSPKVPPLPEGQAQVIDMWTRALAPKPEQVRELAHLTLLLRAPEEGEEWPLTVSIGGATVEAEEAAVEGEDVGEVEDPAAQGEGTVAALEHLGTICPALSALGKHKKLPASLELTPSGVIDVVEAREQLAAHGFELSLPPELEVFSKAQARAVVETPQAESSGLFSADGICSYHYELAVEDKWLSAEEVSALAASKAPLVRVRGRWHRLEPRAVARAVKLISAGEREAGLFDALRLSQGLESTGEDEQEQDDEQASGGQDLTMADPRVSEELLALLDGSLTGSVAAPKTPRGFHGKLRDYQSFGLGWMQYMEQRGLGACLADDMGLGKTIECLSLLEDERAHVPRAKRGPTLLVVPFSAVANWEEEAERFCPQLSFHIHHGTDRHKKGGLAKALATSDVCMTSFDLLVRDLDELRNIPWHRMVLDEVQVIKNDYTKVAQAAFSIKAGRLLALSGTPVENRLTELWSVMHLLNPGLLGTRETFVSEFSTPIEKNNDEEAAARLRALVAPFILRRTKADPEIRKELPNKIERTRPCPLSADQAALYQATVEEMLRSIAEAEPKKRSALVLKAITSLKQICNHPLNFADDGGPLQGRSGKLAELERIAADARAVSEKTLCFTQYPSFARRLAPYLSEKHECGVEVFDGKLSAKARTALRNRFATDEDLGLLLVSYGAGGKAVNMIAANHVVLYDRWWNPAVEEQAADRAYRIGQDKDVYVHRLVSAGTLEERIEEMLRRKRALSELVISSLAADIVHLDNTDLRELFSLSTRALKESWS